MAQKLIVEDEISINTLIRKNLELVGHSCTSVFDGESVFDEIEKQNPLLLRCTKKEEGSPSM